MALLTGVSRAWTWTLAIMLFCAPLVGQTHETLHSFSNAQGLPISTLLESSDGKIYGTTLSGGDWGRGSVYVLTPDGMGGVTFSTLTSFDPQNDNPYWVAAGLIEGSDGNFYGTTQGGGEHSLGTIFRMNGAGGITTVHSFSGLDGSEIEAAPWKVRAESSTERPLEGASTPTARSFGWRSTATVSRCCTTSRSSRDSRNGTD